MVSHLYDAVSSLEKKKTKKKQSSFSGTLHVAPFLCLARRRVLNYRSGRRFICMPQVQRHKSGRFEEVGEEEKKQKNNTNKMKPPLPDFNEMATQSCRPIAGRCGPRRRVELRSRGVTSEYGH